MWLLSPSLPFFFSFSLTSQQKPNKIPVQLLQPRNTYPSISLYYFAFCILHPNHFFHFFHLFSHPDHCPPSSLEKGDTHSTHFVPSTFIRPSQFTSFSTPIRLSFLIQAHTTRNQQTYFDHSLPILTYTHPYLQRCRSMYQAKSSISQSMEMPIQTNYNFPHHNIVSSKNNVSISSIQLLHKRKPKKEDPT